MENCSICNKSLSDGKSTVILKTKGSDGVNRASSERGSDLIVMPRDKVHTECRRNYCKPANITRDLASQQEPSKTKRDLRSEQTRFSFRDHCLFCGHAANIQKMRLTECDVFMVRTGDFQERIFQVCNERNDNWSETILGRIASVNDLHAADAVYHQQCSSNFRTGKNIPIKLEADAGNQHEKIKPGRPETDVRTAAFFQVMQFLEENDEEQMTLNDLILKMGEFLQGTDFKLYGAKWMRTKIKEHFGSSVIMTAPSTKACVVTLRDTASSILHAFHKKQNSSIEDYRLHSKDTASATKDYVYWQKY